MDARRRSRSPARADGRRRRATSCSPRSSAERMKRLGAGSSTAYKEGRDHQRTRDRPHQGWSHRRRRAARVPARLVGRHQARSNISIRCAGEELEFKVISLDRRRNNIVLSRKAVLEKEYEKKKKETLTKLVKEGCGTPRRGQEHHRLRCVHRPRRHRRSPAHHRHLLGARQPPLRALRRSVTRVEVVILKFDPETERVSLGYKQK